MNDNEILEAKDKKKLINVKHECEELFEDVIEMIGVNSMYNELLMIVASKSECNYRDRHRKNTENYNNYCCTFGNIICLIIGMLIMYLYES